MWVADQPVVCEHVEIIALQDHETAGSKAAWPGHRSERADDVIKRFQTFEEGEVIRD